MNESLVEQRQLKQKEALIEQLRKTPIIQIACDKISLGRATFYRWRKDDKEFAESVGQALDDGLQLVSDMAESKLISAIKQENLTAIMFWLKNRHSNYANKLEVTGNLNQTQPELTPDQQKAVETALKLVVSPDYVESDPEIKNHESDTTAGIAPSDL